MMSCTPNEDDYGPRTVYIEQIDSTSNNWLYILNEGNFTWNNASLTAHDFNSDITVQEAFKQVNSQPLGDVAQSMFVRNDTGFIVVNNSGKIEVVKLPSMSKLYTIEGLQSPRYMDCISDTCYVTDLYANQIHVITITGTRIGEIPLNGHFEELKLTGSLLYVRSIADSNSSVIVINRVTNQIDHLLTANASSVTFENDAVYWLENGNLYRGYYGINSPELLSSGFPLKARNLSLDKNREECYYTIGNVVWLADYSQNEMDGIIWYQSDGLNIYNFGFNASTSEVYIVNAKDYTRQGEVILLNSSGAEKNRLITGVIPNEVVWYNR